jgi:prepilin-type N-terminal cleavage/methylation domain-containing protein
MIKIKLHKNRGFTIIETMIAIAIFLIVVSVGMGALLNANLVHNKSQNMRSIMDNLSFVMDDMSRNLRTGYNYHCGDFANIEVPQSCPPGGNILGYIIFFETPTGIVGNSSDQWGYRIASTDGGKTFNISKTVDGGSSWVQLNSSDINLSPISGFTVIGAESPAMNGNQQQPFVTIRLVGTINYQNISTPFDLQTSVSQRLIDR